MRRKTSSVMLIASLVFALGLVTSIRPAKAEEPYVKIYVDPPLVPFVAPGTKFQFDVMIETNGITDWTDPESIIAWAMDLQVDPDVISINTTVVGPPPFPPVAEAKVIGAQAGYFLWEFAQMMALPNPTLFSGTADPLTGYWDEAAVETFLPSPDGGAGDYTSGLYPKLVTFEVTSKSDTQSCLIDIIDFEYRGADGVWRSPDVVEDGYYGGAPHAEFTYTPSTPLVDETVTFNATDSYDPDGGDLVSYDWDFGDETAPGTGNITTHAYTEPGIYTVTLNVTDDEGSWATESKDVAIYGPPVASFTYSPSAPSSDETVTFNGSCSYDPDGGNATYPSGIVSYEWDFGDEATGTGNLTEHTYAEAGTYTVILNVTDDEGMSSNATDTVTVAGAAVAAGLEVEVDVGSIHFRGEIAEFYVLVSFRGEPVNAAQINARLYYSGALLADLSGDVENVTTGLYLVPYNIPSDASFGSYVLVVNASFSTKKGVSLKSFLLSQTLTDQNALMTDIEGDIATILTDVGAIKVNLVTIDATMVGMENSLATISSTIGEFTASADTICAVLIDIEDDVAVIKSVVWPRLGTIEEDIKDINGEIDSISGTLVTIQTDIGRIQTNVTAINAKLTAISGTVGIINSTLGDIPVHMADINSAIVDIQDGFVTINSTLGDIQLDLDYVKEDISLQLVSVKGDIEEGVANVTAAITDSEGNILLELGQVEVKLEDINATLASVDGSLVSIRTDIGTIKGKITSIRGDVATIETDIGVILVILEEWTGATTSTITTPAGSFDIMVLTNSTLEGPVTFSDNALTLTVSGQTGTTGILNLRVPRQLLVGIGSNIEELVVTINDRRISFTYTEEAELYLVRFLYTHSTHTIKVYLSESQTPHARALWILLAVAFTIAVSAIVATPYILATRKKPSAHNLSGSTEKIK